MTTPFPEQGRIVGIDYGDVRVGIALSDPQQKWASPLEQYHRRTPALDAQYFAALKQREGVLGWVVGLPVMPNGTDSAKSVQVRKFGEWLTEHTGLPVRFFDERYTSRMAEELLIDAQVKASKRKALRDKLAAQILLSSYFERDQSRDDQGRTQSESSRGLDD